MISYVPHQLKLQVRNWEQKLQNVMQNTELETDNKHSHFETEKIQEEWMILSDFHNISSSLSDKSTDFANSLQYWQLQSDNYTEKQISEMPNWINAQKKTAFSRSRQIYSVMNKDLPMIL